MNFTLVVMGLREWGKRGVGLPLLGLTRTCITNDFTNVSPVMGCLQVICGHLDIFKVI